MPYTTFTPNISPVRNEKLIRQVLDAIEKKAENLFLTRQLQCSEIVVLVINQTFGGALTPETAVQVSSGLAEGMGGSGCTCGALTGGVLALGLFLGRKTPGIGNSRNIMGLSKTFHDAFKKRFGLPCCRLLTKKIKNGSQEHFMRCAGHTAWAAREVGKMIIQEKPKVLDRIDWEYLSVHDSRLTANMKRLTCFFHKFI